MNYPHPMDDTTGFEATDEEMGLAKQKLFQCDCCGEMVPRDEISFTFAFGMDTAACDKCRDWQP
jgi:hypothetical protein